MWQLFCLNGPAPTLSATGLPRPTQAALTSATLQPLPFHHRQITIPTKFVPISGGFPRTGTPVGLDGKDRVWEVVSDCLPCTYLVRCDPYHRRFAPGGAFPGWGPYTTYVSTGGIAWTINAQMGGQWITRVRFGHDRPRCCRGRGQFNDVSVSKNGAAWVAGWRTKAQSSYIFMGPHAAGLPSVIPPGHAALFYGTSRSHRLSPIQVPAPAPLTEVIVHGRTVWSLDRYRRCIHSSSGNHWQPPRILSYAVRSHRFASFILPRWIRPRICIWWYTYSPEDECMQYPETPIAIGPDGPPKV